jgi:hypothetical protein
VLQGRNLSISDIYENFTQSSYTEFYLNDFNNEFFESFESAWYDLDAAFFRNHEPILCFVKYGQNVLLNEQSDLHYWITSDFEVDNIEYVQFSIATNLSINNPNPVNVPNAEQQNGIEQEQNVPPEEENHRDPNILNIGPVPLLSIPLSVCLGTESVGRICEGGNGYATYTKAFNSSLSNFKCNGIPTRFNDCTSANIKPIGLHGYSTVANILRRTSASEPFMSRPVARLLASHTATDLNKYSTAIKNQSAMIQGSIQNMVQNGTSYRLEMTFETSRTNVPTFDGECADILLKLNDKTRDVLVEEAVLVPASVFPFCIGKFCEKMMEGIQPILDRFKDNSEQVKVTEKEMCVMFENLVKYFHLDQVLYKWQPNQHWTYIVLIIKNQTKSIEIEFSLLRDSCFQRWA